MKIAMRKGKLDWNELYGHTGATDDEWTLPDYAFPKEEFKIKPDDISSDENPQSQTHSGTFFTWF